MCGNVMKLGGMPHLRAGIHFVLTLYFFFRAGFPAACAAVCCLIGFFGVSDKRGGGTDDNLRPQTQVEYFLYWKQSTWFNGLFT